MEFMEVVRKVRTPRREKRSGGAVGRSGGAGERYGGAGERCGGAGERCGGAGGRGDTSPIIKRRRVAPSLPPRTPLRMR